MESKKVIYFGFYNERLLIIDQLKKNYNWKPVMLLGTKKILQPFSKKNPEVFIQDEIQLRQAIFDYSEIGEPVPIGEDLVSVFKEFETNFFSIFEVKTGFEYSYSEMKRFYYESLKYWNTILHHFKPDLVVGFTFPHTHSCYPLYILAKYYFNTKVLFVNPTPLLNNASHMVGHSLEAQFSPFYNLYKSDKELTLGKEGSDYIASIKNSELPIHMKTTYRLFAASSSFRWKELFRLLASTLIKGTGFKKAQSAMKKNFKPYNSPASRMNEFEFFYFRDLLRLKNLKLIKYYKKYIIKPDLNKKFIYFAASYQPEARTNTSVGIFKDQFLALDILSSSIPDDWVIYYKEHPATFDRSYINKAFYYRSDEYFKHIASYKNIELIPHDTCSFSLMDKAQAVSTVAGTPCWEAIVRGTPALVFGSNWYAGCKSLFVIKNLNDAKRAIQMIIEGYKPDDKDIERYVAAIEQTAEKNIIHRYFHDTIKRVKDPEFEMKRIADLYAKAYKALESKF